MRILLSLAILIIFVTGCCRKNQKNLVAEKEPVFVSNELTSESREIPKDLDSAVKALLPHSSTFWLLHDTRIQSWPKHLKAIIQRTICNESKEDCRPSRFGIQNINDSLELITDYYSEGTTDSWSFEKHNYIYNLHSNKFVCLAIGTIYGIVKSPDFVGFIFQFRYSDNDDIFKTYASLEEFHKNKVVTREILTPNTFPTFDEQEIHFNYFKEKYFSRRVE